MALVDLSATGDEDLLNARAEADGDARWRDEQLLRLKDEVFDLEETGGGVTLADFALDDFRARAMSLLCIAGHAGLPQVSMPLATLQGCPLGLSLVAGRGNDVLLLCLARQIADQITR